MSKEPLLLNLHIPFCTERCVYWDEPIVWQNLGACCCTLPYLVGERLGQGEA